VYAGHMLMKKHPSEKYFCRRGIRIVVGIQEIFLGGWGREE
jgi:hypothetical protein